jgi:serralysin
MATITVTTLNDVVADDGLVSLREAIAAADNGNDTLSGGKGSDTLGGAGKDKLTGGNGLDWFIFKKPDKTFGTIIDFKHGVDKLGLDHAIFAAIGPTIESDEFLKSDVTKALETDDRLVYNTKSGVLLYESGGSDKASKPSTSRPSPTTSTSAQTTS